MKERFYHRDLEEKLLKWIQRKEAYAIKGPRQSGKTTLLKILQNILEKKGDVKTVFLNFEDPDVVEAFETNPKEYIKSFMLERKRYFFLMDEYQYIKDLGKKLKLLYDTFENTKFIVTGSSSLELSGAMAKYLVGRIFFFELFPFNFHEFLNVKDKRLARIYKEKNEMIKKFLFEGVYTLADDVFIKEFFPLFEEYLIFGGYPAVVKELDIETKKFILKNIYNTYIAKDVIEFLRFSDAIKYRKVVRMLALLIGNLVNYSEICSACDIYYKELKNMLSVLSETYIIGLIQPFYTNPVTELKKTPKLYFFDTGLRNSIISNFNPLEKRIDSGALVENFVFQSLRRNFEEFNYWRTISKAEVDFVLRIKNNIVPIEVKYRSFNKPKVSRSMRNFIKQYNIKRAVVATKSFWGKTKVGNAIVLFAPVFYF